MLNNVAEAAKRTARIMTMRHPNSVDVVVYRKVVNRTEPAAPNARPSLKDAMLTPEDESNYEIVLLGEAKMLFVERLQGAEFAQSGGLTFSEEGAGLVSAYIEPCECGDDGFQVKKRDRVFWILPDHTIGYSVKHVVSPTHLPPYVSVFHLEPLEHEDMPESMP